jgi:hypothetical protein
VKKGGTPNLAMKIMIRGRPRAEQIFWYFHALRVWWSGLKTALISSYTFPIFMPGGII